MKTKFALISIIIVTSMACNSKIKESNLYGFYTFKELNTRDSIFILNNNRYIRKYINKKNEIFTIQGSWYFSNKGQEIKFCDFIFINEEGLEPPQVAWYAKVKQINNEIRIFYSKEDNVYYSNKP